MTGRLAELLGDLLPTPKAPAHNATLVLACSGEILPRLLERWGSLPVDSRPALRGAAVSRPDGVTPVLNLLIDPSDAPVLLLEVTWRDGKPLPSLSGLWPYAAWWEEEMRRFENVDVAGANSGGVRWLPR